MQPVSLLNTVLFIIPQPPTSILCAIIVLLYLCVIVHAQYIVLSWPRQNPGVQHSIVLVTDSTYTGLHVKYGKGGTSSTLRSVNTFGEG